MPCWSGVKAVFADQRHEATAVKKAGHQLSLAPAHKLKLLVLGATYGNDEPAAITRAVHFPQLLYQSRRDAWSGSGNNDDVIGGMLRKSQSTVANHNFDIVIAKISKLWLATVLWDFLNMPPMTSS